jgi:hypothetical protein
VRRTALRRLFLPALVLAGVATAAAGRDARAGEAAPAAGRAAQAEWRTFEGSWSASGHRQTLQTEGDRPAATVQLSGAVVLTKGEGLSLGFRAEAIGFDDGRSLSLGRAVWTDEHGDRIFSELKGEPMGTGKRIAGAITGGTGRYAGMTGEYSLEWQYVVQAEDGLVQGRTVGLKGKWRRGGPAAPGVGAREEKPREEKH